MSHSYWGQRFFYKSIASCSLSLLPVFCHKAVKYADFKDKHGELYLKVSFVEGFLSLINYVHRCNFFFFRTQGSTTNVNST